MLQGSPLPSGATVVQLPSASPQQTRQQLQSPSPQLVQEVPVGPGIGQSTLTLKGATPVNFNVISGMSTLQNVQVSYLLQHFL
jgi:hypothetical protein